MTDVMAWRLGARWTDDVVPPYADLDDWDDDEDDDWDDDWDEEEEWDEDDWDEDWEDDDQLRSAPMPGDLRA